MSEVAASVTRDQSPPLMMLGIIYTLLFNAGLLAVSPLFASGSFPVPSSSAEQIASFFRENGRQIVITSALQFGSAIPLGLFTATIANRLRFLGVRAAGVNIALFGGWTTVALMLVATSMMWTTASVANVASDDLLFALYQLQMALGGPGFSVPFGLLLAGIAVTGWLSRSLPKWFAVLGVVLAIIGELSWLFLLTPKALPLIPLVRFPGFPWLIVAAWLLPNTRAAGISHSEN
jgi:hypothetical protein